MSSGLLLGVLTPLLALATSGCSPSSAGQPPSHRLIVFAAASLTKAFTDEGRAFEAAHPGIRVVLSFAGSQTLVAQVRQGAPASVLATADLASLQAVGGELRSGPVVFAHNQLALITERGNPLQLRSLADLRRRNLKVVLAAPTVPLGRAAAVALARARVALSPVSMEDAVTGVVTKVGLGEADAGIAYVTDLQSDQIGGIPLPGTGTELAIAAVAGDPRPADTDLFIAFVRSPQGQQILQSYGFS